jgi:HAD superfamily hydrolase (TIGR01490 family)
VIQLLELRQGSQVGHGGRLKNVRYQFDSDPCHSDILKYNVWKFERGSSSVGRAFPCQGKGRRFKSGLPLIKKGNIMEKLAFFDLDDTLYNGASPVDFNSFLVSEGICPNSLMEQVQAAASAYRSGTRTYAETVETILGATAAHLKGHSVEEIKEIAQKFNETHNKLFDYALKLIPLLSESGFRCIVVSGSSLPVVSALTAGLPIDTIFATEFEQRDGIYTGSLTRLMDGAEKERSLRSLYPDVEAAFSLGFGDSTGDTDMLSLADHAFVMNPKQEEMRTLSRERGWTITDPENILFDVKTTIAHLAK